MTDSIAHLRGWEIPNIATFQEGNGGLPRLEIVTPAGTAELYLHGAHVTRFQPKAAAPVLFMSEASLFAPNKPIRGGVPVIFPWFGPRATDPAAPAHGFARLMAWNVESIRQNPDGNVSVVLSLESSVQTTPHWPHAFALKYRVEVGHELAVDLEVENRSDTPFSFDEALHTYFAVSDVRSVHVTGLQDADFLDKMDGMKRKRQGTEPIAISAETDRIYLQTTSTCFIDDPGLNRRIVVEKEGSKTTVLWNPWVAKAKAMPDFGDEEWPGMLCIETANASEDTLTLAPGSRHNMRARIRIEPR